MGRLERLRDHVDLQRVKMPLAGKRDAGVPRDPKNRRKCDRSDGLLPISEYSHDTRTGGRVLGKVGNMSIRGRSQGDINGEYSTMMRG